MPRGRVTPLNHDEALAVCAKILAKHPDILERARRTGSTVTSSAIGLWLLSRDFYLPAEWITR